MSLGSDHQHDGGNPHQDGDHPEQQAEPLRLVHAPSFEPPRQNGRGRWQGERLSGWGPRTESVASDSQ